MLLFFSQNASFFCVYHVAFQDDYDGNLACEYCIQFFQYNSTLHYLQTLLQAQLKKVLIDCCSHNLCLLFSYLQIWFVRNNSMMFKLHIIWAKPEQWNTYRCTWCKGRCLQGVHVGRTVFLVPIYVCIEGIYLLCHLIDSYHTFPVVIQK